MQREIPKLKNLPDLEDFLYYEIGVMNMEKVRFLLDVIKKHKKFLKDHK